VNLILDSSFLPELKYVITQISQKKTVLYYLNKGDMAEQWGTSSHKKNLQEHQINCIYRVANPRDPRKPQM